MIQVIGCICIIGIIYLLILTFKKKEYKNTLTIKSIIRWEQLTNKPFSSMDFKNEGDVMRLLYVCETKDLNYDEYIKMIKPTELRKQLIRLEKHLKFINQFQTKNNSKDENSTPIYIKDIAQTLILAGYGSHYILNEVLLSDLSVLINGYENQQKELYERERMWTYLLLSPNLKKGTSITDIMPLAWDKKEEEEDSISDAEAIRRFKIFTKQGL